MKNSIKRAQSRIRSSFAERKNFGPTAKQRIISILALLCLTVVSAWADGYYVVGTMTDWKINSQYKLSVNTGNTAEMMISMYFGAGAEFKVVYSEDGENAKT